MLPEISRRCSSCGASIRQRDALFCSECGTAVPAISKAKESAQPPAVEESDEALNSKPADEVVNAAVVDESVNANQANQSGNIKDDVTQPASEPTPQFNGREETSNPSTQPVAPAKRESSTQGGRVKPQPNIAGRAHSGVAERTRETLHRASTVARGVIEDEVKRVEKIRQVSSVVIEEASYDPSLRFVLVALVLFIVFIILLVLSKVMG